jgi:flagellar protein FlgJ
MVAPIGNLGSGAVGGSPGASAGTSMGASFALDAQALSALQIKAKGAPDKALKQAATQFEAVFMNMLLKSMRDTVPKDGAMESEATRTYTSMMDQQLTQNMASKGIGLADLIVKQLSRQMGTAGAGVTPAATPALDKAAALQKLRDTLGAATATDKAPQAQQFVQTMLPYAQAAERSTGIPARHILAQAALESGWGKSEPRASDGTLSHNLFGIKAGRDWTGPVAETTTTEFVNGVAQKVTQRFRAYASYADSFADHARLLTNNPRYRGVLSQGNDAAGFGAALQQAGYATDPRYAEKITRIIQGNLGGIVS